MFINQITENEDGTARINGTLSGAELEAVVSVGLNVLYAQGLMSQLVPSLGVDEDVEVEIQDFHQEPEQQQ